MICVVDSLNFLVLLGNGLMLSIEPSVEGVEECTCSVTLIFKGFDSGGAVIDGSCHCHCLGDGVVRDGLNVVFLVVCFRLSCTVTFGWWSLLVGLMLLWVGSCEVYKGFCVYLNGCVYSWISGDCNVPVFNVVVNRLR